MFLLVLFCFFRRRKQIFQTQRRKVAETQSFSFSRTQITQIEGIISFALVIDIPKIPKICGYIFL
jgi:hypothetical protein